MPKCKLSNRYHPEVWDAKTGSWRSLNNNQGLPDTIVSVKVVRAAAKLAKIPTQYRVVATTKLMDVTHKTRVVFGIVDGAGAPLQSEVQPVDPELLEEAENTAVTDIVDQMEEESLKEDEVVDDEVVTAPVEHGIKLPLDTDMGPDMF